MGIDRRFPRVLAEQLSYALFITRPLGDQALELLAIYRENLRKSIAEGGLDADFSECGKGIPPELMHSIRLLHEAFEALHKFRKPGGEDDYMSNSVYRLAQKITAGGGRSRATDNKLIMKEAWRLGYFNLPKRSREKGVVIDEIISNLHLYKGVGTSKASQHRNIKRILGSYRSGPMKY